MPHRPLDPEKLRVAFRRMSRRDLLTVADRAAQLLPRAKLSALAADLVPVRDLEETRSGAGSLLGEVRMFHAASLRGEYYESFDVNSKNYMEQSRGTEEFIAEFQRMLGACIRAAARGPQAREAFELLFELIRTIDDSPDEVIFFADEGGSWQVGVDWRSALPAYFRSLADAAASEEFACAVDRVISDFAEVGRSRHLTAARRVASADQKAALRRLGKPGRRRQRGPGV